MCSKCVSVAVCVCVVAVLCEFMGKLSYLIDKREEETKAHFTANSVHKKQ